MQNGITALEKKLAVSQKIKHRVNIWLSNSTSRYKPKRNENIGHSKNYLWMFTAMLYIKAKKWKQPKCSSING